MLHSAFFFFFPVCGDVADDENDDDSPASGESEEAHASFLQSVTFMRLSLSVCHLQDVPSFVITKNS